MLRKFFRYLVISWNLVKQKWGRSEVPHATRFKEGVCVKVELCHVWRISTAYCREWANWILRRLYTVLYCKMHCGKVHCGIISPHLTVIKRCRRAVGSTEVVVVSNPTRFKRKLNTIWCERSASLEKIESSVYGACNTQHPKSSLPFVQKWNGLTRLTRTSSKGREIRWHTVHDKTCSTCIVVQCCVSSHNIEHARRSNARPREHAGIQTPCFSNPHLSFYILSNHVILILGHYKKIHLTLESEICYINVRMSALLISDLTCW